MKDETYVYISDVKEKGAVGRSARARRTHTGKGGRVRLPSDSLSKKELQQMNGECKSYRLNDPMKWEDFKAMPDDIKVTYIKLLRQKFNPPVIQIAKMMGVTEACVRRELQKFGLTDGKRRSGRLKWDKEGFWAWVNGVDKLPEPVNEEIHVEEPIQEEPESFVEDDLPFDIVPVEEPDPIYPKQPELYYALCAEMDELKKRVDELLKVNEELKAQHLKDKEHISWLELRTDELGMERHILEKQLEIVQLIFGGKNHG